MLQLSGIYNYKNLAPITLFFPLPFGERIEVRGDKHMPDKTIKVHINQQFICPECGWVMVIVLSSSRPSRRIHTCLNGDCENLQIKYEAPKTELTLYEK
jgi:predicted RNA-binding Zn-ribbon protein involved in translation (DUF1610 family)